MATILGAAISAFPLLLNHRAYFRDDMQSQYTPIFVSVGQNILEGRLPFVTLQMQNGGALLAEYQYALLNPISLAIYAIASLTGSLPAAAATITTFHIVILCVGTYVLGLACKASREMALVAAVAFSANNFIYYWYATSWIPGLVSITWFVWAAAYIIMAHQGRLQWALAVAFVYLTISSGWPHTVLALGAFGIIYALTRCIHDKGLGASLPIFSSLVIGALIASPAVLPLLAMSRTSARDTGVLNSAGMVVNLYELMGLSSPFQFGHSRWGSAIDFLTPIFYCAWFVLPFLPLLKWNRLLARHVPIAALSILTLLTIVATQGPDTVGSLRTPIRFLPFFHLYILLIFCSAASFCNYWKITPQRTAISFGLVAFGLLSSVQIQPALWLIATVGAAILAFLLTTFILIAKNAPRFFGASIISGTLIIMIFTRVFIPANENVPEWSRTDPAIRSVDLGEVPRGYSFLIAPFGAFIGEDPIVESFGAMPLMKGRSTISGYSPIGLRKFSEAMCVEVHGLVCAQVGAKLFIPTKTGPPLADLLRIDEIRAYTGNGFKLRPKTKDTAWGGWTSIRQHLLADDVQQELDRNWVAVAHDNDIRTYVRRTPKAWPSGSVAWSSSNLRTVSVHARAALERVEVSSVNDSGGSIMFARLAWPGYRAEFKGRSVSVTARENFLVAVDLPAGSGNGELILRYEPPLIRPALLMCGAGLIGLLLGLACWGRFRGPQGERAPAGCDHTLGTHV